MGEETLEVNRAPVLTLWAAVVAERMGHDSQTSLTLGKALAGLNAQSKGRSLGFFGPPKTREGEEPQKSGLGEEFWIDLCGRSVPAKSTSNGVRAVVKDEPIDPGKVQRYLEQKFGKDLPRVRNAMAYLANSFPPEDLAGRAYGFYECSGRRRRRASVDGARKALLI